ncbi:MAG: DUF935 family protein [Candidatus Gastranaerophilales bacterium]|nr:DUF935 family protein [Candidatus Gastranaerophilales bacterium]
MIKNLFSNFSKSKDTVLNIIKVNGRKKHLYDEIASRRDYESFSAALDILPNPDIVLRKKGKSLSIYRELAFDTQVSSGIEQRKAGVTCMNWKLDRENCSDKDYKLILEFLENLNLVDILKGILEAPFYGYQPMEIMWAKDGNNVIPVDLVAKPPEWFYFNCDGILCYKKRGAIKGIELHEEDMKFLLPRNNPTYANPYGDALLSRLFWSVVIKKGGMKFWSVFSEKYGMPFLIAKYNKGQSQKEIDSLADMLDNMVQDAIAVIPNDSSVEIKDSSSKASSITVFDKLISRCDGNISKTILGQTLTTEAGASGSYALGNVHSGIRQDIILSDKRLCEKMMNKLIHMTMIVNVGDVPCPKFTLYKEKGIDKDLAERDKTISEILEKDGRALSDNYLVRTYNYQPGDITKIKPQTNDSGKTDFVQFPNEHRTEFKSVKLPTSDELENLSESLKDSELQSQMENVLKPVLKLFEETKDAQEALDKLAETYPEMETKELEELLTKIIFISEVWGRLNND